MGNVSGIEDNSLGDGQPPAGRKTRFDIEWPPFDVMLRRLGKTIPRSVLVALVAVIAAEVFLRLIMPVEVAFETSLTPGAHIPNARYGFVFTPNFHGKMFHVDKVTNVPFSHDQYGFRPPAASASGAPLSEVALIGGASMVYGMGAPDHDTIPFMMTRSASCPLKVYDVAWPGFDTFRMFHIYRDFLEPHVNTRLAVFVLYNIDGNVFTSLPADYDALAPPPPQRELFKFMSNLVIRPLSPLAQKLGSWYFRSFVVARLVSSLDLAWTYASLAFGDAKRLQQKWTHGGQTAATVASQTQLGLVKLAGFLRYGRDYFRQRNVEFMVVILPQDLRYNDPRPYRTHEQLHKLLPPDIPFLDLFAELRPRFKHGEFIAGGHYSAKQNEILGSRLAEEACLLLRAQATPQPAQ